MSDSSMPLAVQQAVASAQAAMLQHPQQTVPPFFRKAIYDAIGSQRQGRAYRVRTRLNLYAAEHVLPVWQQEMSTDTTILRMLDLIRKLLDGAIDVDTARKSAGEAYEWHEKLGSHPEIGARAYCAAAAAIQAVFEATGRDPLEYTPPADAADFEVDYGPDFWSTDAASFAAAAYAGRLGYPDSDSLQRRGFWQWWLTEAIPQAFSGP